MSDAFPPSAFYFAVRLDPASAGGDGMFQEVSGIGAEVKTEAFLEGGENHFVHALPKGVKHPNLALKRGVVAVDSGLVRWCRQVLDGGLAQPIQTKLIEVHLMGLTGEALRSWRFTGAYPVKWSVASFNSTQHEVALEVVEIAYSAVERVL